MSLKFVAAVVVAAVTTLAGFTATSVVTSDTAEARAPRLVRIYCKRDYRRFCPRYKIGSSRARRCMGANRRSLSRICKRALRATGYARKLGYRRRR